MNQKNSLNFRLGFFASLFASNANYRQLSLLDSTFKLIKKGEQHRTLSYLEFDPHIELQKGWLWYTAELNLLDGTEVLIGGLSKTVAIQLVEQTKYLATKWLEHFIEINSTHLVSAYSEAEKDIINGRYIQSPLVNEWIDKHQSLRSLVTYPKLDIYLDEDLLIYARSLKPLLIGKLSFVERYNQAFIKREIDTYSAFFDTIENQPLTQRQREACVINEKNNLVLAGAGTGKTSTMIGRAGYLLKSDLAKPEQILMLAFGNAAAKEMGDRIKSKLNEENITISTFHSFGQQIITTVEGKKPSIHKMAEDNLLKANFIDNELAHLMYSDISYQKELVNYFITLANKYENIFHFKTLGEYFQYIKENDIRSLQGELVKSYEENEIANFLFRNGIKYEYEANYKANTSGPDFRIYQPDFYLPDYDIYIEHFAIDKQYNTPPFIDNDKYVEGIKWKRSLHKKYKTTLIETYSYQKHNGTLLSSLKTALLSENVTLSPLSDNDLLNHINKTGNITKFGQLLANLLTLFKSTLLSLQGLFDKAQLSDESAKAISLFKLFKPIYNAYQKKLAETDTIDFDDMINKAIGYVESGKYISHYTHILVDEFQDISASRARLLNGLLNQNANNTLFCVGDDWQSIYQFTGSDISIIRDFNDYFGYTAISKLDTTFRFNNKIGDIASQFVMKNPLQIKKQIKSHTQVNDPRLSLLMIGNNEKGLDTALSLIVQKSPITPCSVLVLVRFKHLKPKLAQYKHRYPHIQIASMTTHAAKGKEADYIILLGLEKGEFGFPSEKTTNPILQLLLPKSEPFAYAEERRLFYVALTRARKHIYLVTNPKAPSIFVRELIKQKNDIIKESPAGYLLDIDISDTPCPICKQGYMVQREGKNGTFYGCSNYPLCNNTSSGCHKCGNNVREAGRFRICESTSCDHVVPICPICNGNMILRKGQYGTFWGCSHYRNEAEFSCSHTEKFIDLKEAKQL